MLERLVRLMEREQAKNPGSRAASSWLAAGLRAQGELERAWQASIAAWVRAPIAGTRPSGCAPTSTGSCAKASFPTVARKPPKTNASPRETSLRAEWELVKQKWKYSDGRD